MWHLPIEKTETLVGCEMARMPVAETARVLGITAEELQSWRQWLAFWSARYVDPECLPEPAQASPLPQETASEPPPGTAAPSLWVDMVRVAAAGESVAAADEEAAADAF